MDIGILPADGVLARGDGSTPKEFTVYHGIAQNIENLHFSWNCVKFEKSL